MLRLYGCNPTPQVVALLLDKLESLTRDTVLLDDAGAELELALDDCEALVTALWDAEPEPAVLEVPELLVWPPTEVGLVCKPLSADDTSELRLESSAEFVTVLTGTNDEPTIDMLEMTDCEAELVGFEVELLGETKLRLVVGAVEDVFDVAAGFVEVLQTGQTLQTHIASWFVKNNKDYSHSHSFDRRGGSNSSFRNSYGHRRLPKSCRSGRCSRVA